MCDTFEICALNLKDAICEDSNTVRREIIRILSMVPISFIENANAQTISVNPEFSTYAEKNKKILKTKFLEVLLL